MAKSNFKQQAVMANSVEIFQILKRIPSIEEEDARVLANEITRNRDVATKMDLMDLRRDLEEKISDTKSDLEKKISASHKELRQELRHTIWAVAGLLLTAQTVAFAAVGFLL